MELSKMENKYIDIFTNVGFSFVAGVVLSFISLANTNEEKLVLMMRFGFMGICMIIIPYALIHLLRK